MEFVKTARQIAAADTDIHAISERILTQAVERFEVQTAAVFLISQKKKDVQLAAASGISFVSRAELSQIAFHINAIQEAAHKDSLAADASIVSLPSRISMPDVVLPMTAGKKVVGVVVLWKNPAAIWNDEDVINLRLTADVIAKKIQSEHERMRDEFQDCCERMSRRLGSVVDSRSTLKENFARAAHVIRELSGIETLCLLAGTRETGMVRMMSGGGGTVLEERGSIAEMYRDQLHAMVHEPSGMKTVTATGVGQSTFMPNDEGQFLTVPLSGVRNGRAILTASIPVHKTNHAVAIELMKLAASSFTMMISDEQARNKERIVNERIHTLKQLVDDAHPNANLVSVFRTCAIALVDSLGLHRAAISTVDRGAAHLVVRSVVGQQLRSRMTEIVASARLDLADLTAHNVAVDTGTLIHAPVGHGELSISHKEADQTMLTGSQAMTIIPIVIRGQVLALMTLGHAHEIDEMSDGDLAFTSTVASLLGYAIETTLTIATLSKTRAQLSYPSVVSNHGREHSDSNTGRIKSALSGILGSMELIRTTGRDLDETTSRYLTIIEKSADKMRSYVEEDASVEG
jgi:GAF domain-containing protein